VAIEPAPNPPYQELNITARKKSEKWLGSALDGMSDARPRASATVPIAIVYRSSGGRSSINMRVHHLEKVCCLDVEKSVAVMMAVCTHFQ
jgi:hypothetical protein